METAVQLQGSELDNRYWAYRNNGGDVDLERVVVAGRKLVCHFARLYTGGVGDDAVQVGMVGLLKAVARFEPGKGVLFSTYAAHCIMGEIRHFVRKETSYYRPGSIADLQYRVDRMVEEVLKETGDVPKLKEIAASLNVKEEGIVQAMRAGLVSLEDVDLKAIRNVRYETFRLPIEDRIILEQAVSKLGELQKKVIYLLFYRDMTQVQAAEKLGISQRKVSRILHKSLQQLAKVMKM